MTHPVFSTSTQRYEKAPTILAVQTTLKVTNGAMSSLSTYCSLLSSVPLMMEVSKSALAIVLKLEMQIGVTVRIF